MLLYTKLEWVLNSDARKPMPSWARTLDTWVRRSAECELSRDGDDVAFAPEILGTNHFLAFNLSESRFGLVSFHLRLPSRSLGMSFHS